MIKAVLALEHKTIPPNILFHVPNPDIPWESAHLSVPTEALQWPGSRRERVSINSFGVGGTNVRSTSRKRQGMLDTDLPARAQAHVILDASEPFCNGVSADSPANDASPDGSSHLLLLSAATANSLASHVKKYETLSGPGRRAEVDLGDVAYTLGFRRDHMAYRAFAVISELQQEEPAVFHLGSSLISSSSRSSVPCRPGQDARVVFICTGQGAQYATMGSRLLQNDGLFRSTIRRLDAALATLPPRDRPEWIIEQELLRPADSSRLDRTEFAMPCSTAVQLALVTVMQSWGIKPDAVIGHSSGEIAAAFVAGAVTMEQALFLSYYRGRIFSQSPLATAGAMAVVGLGVDKVRRLLVPGAVIACENSGSNTTIAGDEAAVEETISIAVKEYPGIFTRRLQVEMAYHSRKY